MADASISAIGKYEIIELLGEGAMGVVYKARDSVLDRTVAIKVMNESIAGQPNLRQRFLREAQSAGSLQHPNVVTIHDLGETDGHLFIAMEFIEGVDLEHLITASPPLSLQGSLDIIIDVLHGLAYAHKRGIVHRDIKPSNIRVGEDGRAKIMDFGVAHLVSSTMTSTGAILGTPSYMAPEQIAEGKTSAATDIFTVGGVLYEILTMMKPFHASTVQNLLFKIVTENPRPVSEMVPGLPRALDHIVRRAMAKEPSERYRNALDMANDLTGVRSTLGGAAVPLSASVANAIEASRKTSGLRTRKIVYVGGGVLAAAALIVIAWPQLSRLGSTKLDAAGTRAPVVMPAPPPVAHKKVTSGTSKTGTSVTSASTQSRPPALSAISQPRAQSTPGLPQVLIPDPSAVERTSTPARPEPSTSLCGGNPRCAQVSTFVATATDLRESVIGGGNDPTRVVGLTVRFRNTTGRPLILGYVSGSGVVTDDRGNRYTTNNVRGLGVVGAGPIDAKFVLGAGESGDARFEFMWAPRGTIFGTRFVVELSVREIESLAGNQWRLGQEHSIHFSGFGEQGVAAAPQ
jgi:serine/threonine-protein kinase